MNEVQSLAAIFISLGWCSCCCCSMLLYRFRSRFLYIILYIIISIPLSLSPPFSSHCQSLSRSLPFCWLVLFTQSFIVSRVFSVKWVYVCARVQLHCVISTAQYMRMPLRCIKIEKKSHTHDCCSSNQQQLAKVTGRQWNCVALRIVRGEVRISQQQTTPTTSTLKTIGQRPQFLFSLIIAISISSARIFLSLSLSPAQFVFVRCVSHSNKSVHTIFV